MDEDPLRDGIEKFQNRYPGFYQGFGRGLCDLVGIIKPIMPKLREAEEHFTNTGVDKAYYKSGRMCGNLTAGAMVLGGGAVGLMMYSIIQ